MQVVCAEVGTMGPHYPKTPTITTTWLTGHAWAQIWVSEVNGSYRFSCQTSFFPPPRKASTLHTWVHSRPVCALISLQCYTRSVEDSICLHDSFNRPPSQPCYHVPHRRCTALTYSHNSPAMTAQHGARPSILSWIDQVPSRSKQRTQ